jgi:hypothetical protein
MLETEIGSVFTLSYGFQTNWNFMITVCSYFPVHLRLCKPPNILTNIYQIFCRAQVADVGQLGNIYKILIRKRWGKRQLERPKHRWKENIRIKVKERCMKVMDGIQEPRCWVGPSGAKVTNVGLQTTVSRRSRCPGFLGASHLLELLLSAQRHVHWTQLPVS